MSRTKSGSKSSICEVCGCGGGKRIVFGARAAGRGNRPLSLSKAVGTREK